MARLFTRDSIFYHALAQASICGDVVQDPMVLDSDDSVKDVRFNGKGCAISQAPASMLTELVKRKSLDEIRKISKEDIFSLIGGESSAVRLKCALLSFKVMKKGLFLSRCWTATRMRFRLLVSRFIGSD